VPGLRARPLWQSPELEAPFGESSCERGVATRLRPPELRGPHPQMQQAWPQARLSLEGHLHSHSLLRLKPVLKQRSQVLEVGISSA
jgi:hypothetical protein